MLYRVMGSLHGSLTIAYSTLYIALNVVVISIFIELGGQRGAAIENACICEKSPYIRITYFHNAGKVCV
jgi:hypothetical protein